MFFTVDLSHDFDYYCAKIDEHIKEDFETKVPDYGAEPFRPMGFHFVRRERTVKGIYRNKYAKEGGNAFLPQSTHMNFRANMVTDKTGERKLSVFMWPQLSQIFILVVSLVFSLLLVRNFENTYIYVIFFAIVFLFSLFETLRLTAITKKEFKKFFE